MVDSLFGYDDVSQPSGDWPMGRKVTVCSNLNQSALSGENVNADRPNKEDDLVDHAVEILDQVVAARDKQTLGEAEVNLLLRVRMKRVAVLSLQ